MDLPNDKCQMKMEIYQTEKERSRNAKKDCIKETKRVTKHQNKK